MRQVGLFLNNFSPKMTLITTAIAQIEVEVPLEMPRGEGCYQDGKIGDLSLHSSTKVNT